MSEGKLIIAGLGPGAEEHISLETLEAMKNADEVILRTQIHPSVSVLTKYNIMYSSLDECYQESDFIAVYEQIVNTVIEKAKDKCIVYAVPGSPQVAEKSVVLLKEKAGKLKIAFKILPALSFLDVFFAKLNFDPVQGFCIIDALKQNQVKQIGNLPTLVLQVYNKQVASELKLTLMEKYPDEFEIIFLHGLGLSEEIVKKIPLFELDRQKEINHLTSIYVPEFSAHMNLNPLVETISHLRAPNGCPWDQEQTFESLRQYLLEEAYEFLDAVAAKDYQAMCDELGDLLLQIVFHARLAEEQGNFSMQDVVTNVVQKMYRRHPHVFGTIQVESSAEVLSNWEQIKRSEYKDRKNALDGIPGSLPALAKAYKLQDKAGKVGFDWPDLESVFIKLSEELTELNEAIRENNPAHIEHELGDVLLVLANISRHLKVHPEVALNQANARFKKRFAYVEKCVQKSQRNWQDFSLAELEAFWQEGKRSIK